MAEGDVYRLSALWEHEASGDDVVNVWHFVQDSALILDTPGEDLVGAFQANVETLYAGIVHVNYTLTKYSVRRVQGNTEAFDLLVSVPGERGVTNDQNAAQVSGIITWTTGLTGRSFRGRTYLPPTSEGDVSGGLFSSTYYPEGMSNFAEAMIVDMSLVTIEFAAWILTVWSPTLEQQTPVTGFVARQVPGVQRKRRIGVGS